MKKYMEYIILILIIIFLTTILYIDKRNKIHYKLPSIPKINKNQITRIVINKGKQNSIILTKKENVWIINNNPKYKVDNKKIDYILNDISNLKLLSQVSKGNDYERYLLDSENRIKISVWDKKNKILVFSIGKLSPNYSSTYIKLENKRAIYLAQGNLRLTFDTDLDELRDKHLLVFNVDDVKKLKINFKGKDLILTKKNNQWISDKKTNNKIVDLIQQLQTIECESFIKTPKNKSTGTKYIEIQLVTNSKTHFLRIFKSNEDKKAIYIGESSNLPDKFKLSDYIVEDLEKDLKNIVSKK